MKSCSEPGCPNLCDTSSRCHLHQPKPWANNNGRQRGLPTTTRKRILQRDQHTCYLCGEPGPPLEIDHRIPVAFGGTDHDDNLAAVCPTCHHTKTKTEAAWGRANPH